MKLIKNLLFISILFLFSNFNSLKNDDRVLLVLTEPITYSESFSLFQVKEVDGVLVGLNVDEYPVSDGIYKVEGSSNDKFYHKNIIILSN